MAKKKKKKKKKKNIEKRAEKMESFVLYFFFSGIGSIKQFLFEQDNEGNLHQNGILTCFSIETFVISHIFDQDPVCQNTVKTCPVFDALYTIYS